MRKQRAIYITREIDKHRGRGLHLEETHVMGRVPVSFQRRDLISTVYITYQRDDQGKRYADEIDWASLEKRLSREEDTHVSVSCSRL